MDYRTIAPLMVLALVGVFFLGRGLTGLVISQSCCFLPDCEEEYLCDMLEENGGESVYLFVGGFLVLMSLFFYVIIHNKAH